MIKWIKQLFCRHIYINFNKIESSDKILPLSIKLSSICNKCKIEKHYYFHYIVQYDLVELYQGIKKDIIKYGHIKREEREE